MIIKTSFVFGLFICTSAFVLFSISNNNTKCFKVACSTMFFPFAFVLSVNTNLMWVGGLAAKKVHLILYISSVTCFVIHRCGILQICFCGLLNIILQYMFMKTFRTFKLFLRSCFNKKRGVTYSSAVY